jgi:ketosteroid isomerase-like protein
MSSNLVDEWFDAFREKDISKLEGALAEDFVHTSPFGEIKGKKTYLDLVKKDPEAFFNHTLEIVDIFDCDDKFAVRYLVDNRPACECIYVRDGQISKIYSYFHVGKKPAL